MLVLSNVDVLLMEKIADHRVLTTGQAAQVASLPLRTANFRLNRLRQLGYADRARPYAQSGSAPLHWWLTTPGRLYVGEPGRVRSASHTPLFLLHTAAIAAVPLALERHGPSVGLRLLTWLRDEQGWESFSTASGSQRITPDGSALVLVEAEDTAVPLLVELDRATMPVTRLREKVRRYLRYSAAEAWQGRHPMCPVLMVLTSTESRAASVIAAAASERKRSGRYTGELLVAASGTTDKAVEAVIGPVWLSDHGADAKRSPAGASTLTDLLAYRVSTERDESHRPVPPWERERVDYVYVSPWETR
jgi:hypothetical protein